MESFLHDMKVHMKLLRLQVSEIPQSEVVLEKKLLEMDIYEAEMKPLIPMSII